MLRLTIFSSFDEMARYDLPAMVDYALAVSGARQVFYVGHSQGGGIGIAQLSQDPVFASKVKMYVGLAPGVYMDSVKSPISLLMPYMEDIEVRPKNMCVSCFSSEKKN